MRGRAPTSALVGQGWGRLGDASSAMATVRPATTKGSGWRAVRGKDLTVARPGTAPWRLAQRRRDETKGRWGPGGRTESDRGRQKGGVASPVFRVTGGDTHHYTNENVGDRPAALPLSGCLSMPPPAQPNPGTEHVSLASPALRVESLLLRHMGGLISYYFCHILCTF